jgi:hypothetical protein
VIITLVFEKNAIFQLKIAKNRENLQKIVEKLQKIVIITSVTGLKGLPDFFLGA